MSKKCCIHAFIDILGTGQENTGELELVPLQANGLMKIAREFETQNAKESLKDIEYEKMAFNYKMMKVFIFMLNLFNYH